MNISRINIKAPITKETGILVSILIFFIILFAVISAAPVHKKKTLPDSSDASFQQQLERNTECKGTDCLGQPHGSWQNKQIEPLPWVVPIEPVKSETPLTKALKWSLYVVKFVALLSIMSSIAYALYYYLLRYIMGVSGIKAVSTALFVRGYLVMLGTIVVFSGLFVLASNILMS